ncbi:MAG TPA: ABC transporter permease [Bryobacteraceae bacterium]|nr:ABC transporter permease [Bryobacteraceae bacterium]
MRFSIIQAIYLKEMLDLLRDRRTLISMVALPVLVIPMLFRGMTYFIGNTEQKAQTEMRTKGIAARVTTPSIRAALEKTGLPIVEKSDLKDAVDKKEVAAAVEETDSTPPVVNIYVDSSEPTSAAAGDAIRTALNDLRDQTVRASLHNSGISETVLSPFIVKRTNIAGERKMAASVWGVTLPYLMLLLMFAGGMYPIIDMTAGEKERKTMEAFLASPAKRREIVLGKTLAGMTAAFLTAALTLASMAYSISNTKVSTKSEEMKQLMSAIPLDASTILLIAALLLPMAVFAASLMFTVALFARSYKEGQSYLTPIMLSVILPALLGGLPGLRQGPEMFLIPIFNTSMMIRGVLLGDPNMVNFAVTLGSDLLYAGIAFILAVRMFERESVLFRS